MRVPCLSPTVGYFSSFFFISASPPMSKLKMIQPKPNKTGKPMANHRVLTNHVQPKVAVLVVHWAKVPKIMPTARSIPTIVLNLSMALRHVRLMDGA